MGHIQKKAKFWGYMYVMYVLHTEEGKVLSRGTELQVGIRVPENPTMSPACARQLVIFCILN